MRIPFDSRRITSLLAEINPLWLLAAGALLMVLVATHVARQHVRDSEWLQARLTGASLVDALHAYAEATPPGASPRPAALADLIDDTRSGQHHNWLDAASAEALKDPANWKLLRDAKGGLLGAHLLNIPAGVTVNSPNAGAGGKGAGAEAGTDGIASADSTDLSTYVVDANAVVAEPVAPSAQTVLQATLPQPVMPDTPVPTPESVAAAKARMTQAAASRPTSAAASAPTPPGPSAPAEAASPGLATLPALRVAQAPVLGTQAASAAKTTVPHAEAQPSLKPTRIIAALEARQVLRLSGGSDPDAPPVFTPPPASASPKKTGAPRRAGISVPDGPAGAAQAGSATASGRQSSGSPVAKGGAGKTGTAAQGPSVTRSTAVARTAGTAGTAASGSASSVASALTGARSSTRDAVAGMQAPQRTTAPSPDASTVKPAANASAGVFSGIQPSGAPGVLGADGQQQASLPPGYALPQPTMPTVTPGDYLPRPPRKARRKPVAPLDNPSPPALDALVAPALLPAAGLGAAPGPGATPSGTPAGIGAVPSTMPGPGAASPTPGGTVGVVGTANGSMGNSGASPGLRLDTVIYEDSQSSAATAPKNLGACRALSGDSGECDALEDGDPDIYQRCYQSLSERINACIAGDPIPPLVTR